MRPTSALSFASITGLVFAACWGRNIPYEGGSGDEDTGSGEVIVQDTCNDDVNTSSGFYLSGTAVDLLTGELLTSDTGSTPLCIRAIDPTPALGGGDPTDLAAAQLCDDGSFLLAGLTEKPGLGMFTVVYDCNDEATVFETATGVSSDDYTPLGDGEGVEGIESKVISLDIVQTWGKEVLNTTGNNEGQKAYSGDLVTDGFLAMFILDANDSPVGDATGGTLGFEQIYYLDGDPSDGYFSTGGSSNTATTVDGLAMVLFPAASINTYSAEDGGTHTWDSELFGSLPGFAVLVNIYAQ